MQEARVRFCVRILPCSPLPTAVFLSGGFFISLRAALFDDDGVQLLGCTGF